MKRAAATNIPGADERRREQERIRKEYPDLLDATLKGATLPNGDKWHPGYDMSIFTNPPTEENSEGPADNAD